MKNKPTSSDTPKLKIAGHSGCQLEIFEYEDDFSVKKTSGDAGYNKRLKEQAQKQRCFYEKSNKLDIFLTAEIINESDFNTLELYWFAMRYVTGDEAIEYFSRVDVHGLKKVADSYIAYFKTMINESKILEAPIKTIQNKITELDKKFLKNPYLEKGLKGPLIHYLKNSIPTEFIYIGNCHGDFSLTNQLFTNRNIFLLDFLDSFIDSPIIDIVKLRQDSNLGRIFTLNRKLENYKTARAYLSISFLDNAVKQFIESDNILKSWYPYLQVLNLARIIPYTSSKSELKFLEEKISNMIKI